MRIRPTPLIAFFVVAFALFAVSGCATAKSAGKDCAAKATPDVVHLVSDALAYKPADATAYQQELTEIAGKYGQCVADAATQQVIDDSVASLNISASIDPLATLRATRGKAYLASHQAALRRDQDHRTIVDLLRLGGARNPLLGRRSIARANC